MKKIEWEDMAVLHGFGTNVRKMLKTMYQDMTMLEIGDKLGISHWSVNNKMIELKIPRRNPSEAMKKREPILPGAQLKKRKKSNKK